MIGKGSKERLVPIHRRALQAVQVYLHDRGERGGVIFLSTRDRPLSRLGALKILRKYVERAGITKRITLT